MKMLSIGEPSTLGNWHKLCSAVFGPESAPTKFIQEKIEKATNGEHEEVIADEGQLLLVLGSMFLDEENKKENSTIKR